MQAAHLTTSWYMARQMHLVLHKLLFQMSQRKASWAEMTVGTKIKLWKGLFMGFTIRYKFLKSIKFTDLQPNYIPGFGENRLDDNDQFGFSYYLAWRFGFRKKPVIPIED